MIFSCSLSGKFQNSPLIENLKGQIKIMSEPELDRQSRLWEKIKAGGGNSPKLPPEPPSMISSIAATGNGYIMSIPEPGGIRNSAAYLIYAVVFGLLVGWYFVWPILSTPSPDPMRLVIGGVFTLVMIGPLLGAIKQFLLRKTRVTIVTISPVFFRVEERDGHKSDVKEIPTGKLDDLILPKGGRKVLDLIRPSPGITAVSGKLKVTFGRGVPEPELRYIHGLIMKVIVGQ